MGAVGWAGVGDIRGHFQLECFYAPMNPNLPLKYARSWVLGRILSLPALPALLGGHTASFLWTFANVTKAPQHSITHQCDVHPAQPWGHIPCPSG